jgi:uncharacterized protein YcfL
MKRKLVVPLLLSLLLSGCSSKGTEKATASSSQSPATSETIELSSSTSASLAETDPGTEVTSQSQNETVATKTTESANAYPYQVDMTQQASVLTFSFEGYNVPDSVAIDQKNSEVTFKNSPLDDSLISRYQAAIATIPTKTIRVFSEGTNQIREVKVNTQISVGEVLDGTQDRQDHHGAMYLFFNHTGGLSLATPNYAGNVPADQMDVMLEVIQ